MSEGGDGESHAGRLFDSPVVQGAPGHSHLLWETHPTRDRTGSTRLERHVTSGLNGLPMLGGHVFQQLALPAIRQLHSHSPAFDGDLASLSPPCLTALISALAIRCSPIPRSTSGRRCRSRAAASYRSESARWPHRLSAPVDCWSWPGSAPRAGGSSSVRCQHAAPVHFVEARHRHEPEKVSLIEVDHGLFTGSWIVS